MEIVGAQAALANANTVALVSSIPADGIIKQFGVDIDEGDEIVAVNGRELRNRSDVEIDRIIGESALETHGELELLVRPAVAQAHHQTMNSRIEEDLTTTTTEETTSSSDLQHDDMLGISSFYLFCL